MTGTRRRIVKSVVADVVLGVAFVGLCVWLSNVPLSLLVLIAVLMVCDQQLCEYLERRQARRVLGRASRPVKTVYTPNSMTVRGKQQYLG